MKHICQLCHREFTRRGTRAAKFCSNSCRGKAKAQVGTELLRQIVSDGEFTTRAGKRLGFCDRTIANALRRAGLYREWRARRYACA